jgi:hypothetical protein
VGVIGLMMFPEGGFFGEGAEVSSNLSVELSSVITLK